MFHAPPVSRLSQTPTSATLKKHDHIKIVSQIQHKKHRRRKFRRPSKNAMKIVLIFLSLAAGFSGLAVVFACVAGDRN